MVHMEDTLDTLFQCWFCHHRMKVNESKTQTTVLGTPVMLRGIPGVRMVFNGSEISDSKEVQKLVVTIGRHLSYKPHVDARTRQCTGMLIALSHSLHVILSSTPATLVQAGLVISTVRYCISVYVSCNATHLHPPHQKNLFTLALV